MIDWLLDQHARFGRAIQAFGEIGVLLRFAGELNPDATAAD